MSDPKFGDVLKPRLPGADDRRIMVVVAGFAIILSFNRYGWTRRRHGEIFSYNKRYWVLDE